MKMRTLLAAAVAAAGIGGSGATQADSVTTAEIITATTSAFFNCADYSLIGTCFWLKCSLSGCSIKTSIKVSHYAPELTFQTYRDAENPPWTEMKMAMNAMQADHDGSLIAIILEAMGSGLGELGGGGGSENNGESHANMTFTLTDAFGNPVMFATSVISSLGFVCNPKLTPLYPYYISNLDTVAWRFSIPEMFYPESLNPFGHELGSSSYNWGGYYPRIGHSTNHDVLKESGLIAFRAAHFISRKNQAHVYTDIVQSKHEGYWPPGPVTETSAKWQQIKPKTENSCHTFPLSAGMGPSDGLGAYRDYDGDHVWNFWRKFKCCKDRGKFLYDIEW